MFHYCSYWRTWSRVLSTNHPYGPFVEVDLTPVREWGPVRAINIRFHGTARGEKDFSVDQLPQEIWELMCQELGRGLAIRLISEDFLPWIDYEEYRRVQNGGAPFAAISKNYPKEQST